MQILRHADLGGSPILLLGRLPQPGMPLVDVFSLPPARRTTAPLTDHELRRGLVIVSTLPNIQRHACIAQIVQLEEECAHRFPDARIVHVSLDAARHWAEVDRFHPCIAAASYTLDGASESSRVSFTWAFGVGVLGHQRIAHGLFALSDGVFVAAQLPFEQMRAPDVGSFIRLLEQQRKESQPCQ
jgi:hypothetical protein